MVREDLLKEERQFYQSAGRGGGEVKAYQVDVETKTKMKQRQSDDTKLLCHGV